MYFLDTNRCIESGQKLIWANIYKALIVKLNFVLMAMERFGFYPGTFYELAIAEDPQ